MQGFCDGTIGEWQDVEKHLLDMSYIQKYKEYIAFLRENRKDLTIQQCLNLKLTFAIKPMGFCHH